LIERLLNSTFVKDVSSLSSGIILAHIVTVVASLFLTRIYTPAEIGYFTFFTSLVIVLTNISTLGYELAIVTTKKKSTSIYLSGGAFFLLCISSTFLLLLILISKFFGYSPEIGIPAGWVIYLPLGLVVTGVIIIAQEWFNQSRKYKLLASTKVIQSISIAIPQILIGFLWMTHFGLLIGFIFGRMTAAFIYLINFLRNDLWKYISPAKIWATLKQYSKYPKYVAPSLIFDRLSLEAPYFLIAILFSETALGFFAIAYRVLSVPLNFIGIAIGQVFFKHLADKKNLAKVLTPSLIKTWLTLAIVGILPMAIIIIGGDTLFEFVFGEGWGASGTIAILLVPMLYIDFISSPTGRSFLVLNLEHYTPFFSVARLIYITGSLLIGYILNDLLFALIILSFARGIALIIQNVILYAKVRQHDQNLFSGSNH
jgi:O-antigen/teichoic acid export membrane protein